MADKGVFRVVGRDDPVVVTRAGSEDEPSPTMSPLDDFRDRLAALAAIEEYIAESGQNAARNIRDLLAGTGADNNDPRVQARAWGLEW